jgi:hypothetical protein
MPPVIESKNNLSLKIIIAGIFLIIILALAGFYIYFNLTPTSPIFPFMPTSTIPVGTTPHPTSTASNNYGDSPFGIYLPDEINYLNDLNIKIVCAFQVFPDAYPNPTVNFKPSDYLIYPQNNISVVLTIAGFKYIYPKPEAGVSFKPSDYLTYLPRVIRDFNDVKYWKLPDESDGEAWDYPQKHAIDIRMAYRVIKDTNPNTKLLSGGTYGRSSSYDNVPYTHARASAGNTPGYYKAIFEELKYMEGVEKGEKQYDGRYAFLNLSQQDLNILFASDNYSKYMDGHHISSFDYALNPGKGLPDYRASTINLISSIKNFLNQYGYGNIELWITQTATQSAPFSNDEANANCVPNMFPDSSQVNQASYLPRKFILSLYNGVDKFFWILFKDFETYGTPCRNSFFTKTGLVDNGVGQDDLGLGVKKLAYYSYKLMVEKLEGSDWNNIIETQPATNVYAYKFINKQTQKPMYIVWWDYWNSPSETTKQVSIPVSGLSGSVKITEAVPHFENGLLLQNSGVAYPNFFNKGVLQTSNGNLNITLGQSPVYIEATTEAVSSYIPHVWSNTVLPVTKTQTGTKTPATDKTPTEKGYCGDGYCDGPAGEKQTCPADCHL